MMKQLIKNFEDRTSLIEYVKSLSDWAEGDASHITGGAQKAYELLNQIDPIEYGKSRNFGNGRVTKLSAYIHHGIINLNEVRNHALKSNSDQKRMEKFIQELGWRDFWQRMALRYPEWVWSDVEEYKTGFNSSDYSKHLPEDILTARTDVSCINSFIEQLLNTGYLHNHARMYVASYIVHFRRIRWQAGADWFLQHLLDGDEASNNFSWQWVASTFSNKPYIFNLENVDKYFSGQVDTSPENNQQLNFSYDVLTHRLFPYRAGF